MPWAVPAGAPCSCWSTGTPPASPAGRERAGFFPHLLDPRWKTSYDGSGYGGGRAAGGPPGLQNRRGRRSRPGVFRFAPAPATGSEPPFWHEVPPGWRNLLAGPGGSSPPTATHVVGLAVGGPPCGRRLETRPFLWKGVRRYVQYPILCPPQALQHLQCPGGRTAPRRPPGRGGGVCHPAGPPERFLFRHRPAVGPPLVEYIIYVHEDDFELAQAALQGTLN